MRGSQVNWVAAANWRHCNHDAALSGLSTTASLLFCALVRVYAGTPVRRHSTCCRALVTPAVCVVLTACKFVRISTYPVHYNRTAAY
jgi:hypothetical protein